MFASTLSARRLLKLAFKAASVKVPSHTYTEKTSERDSNRRSVVFPIHIDNAEFVMPIAIAIFKETGNKESIPKLTISKDYTGYIRAYIRVIAYKN